MRTSGFAVVVFLGYEHLITLDAEVALFWQKRLSGASLLFFVNRYLTLTWAVATAASPYYSSAERFVLLQAQRPTTVFILSMMPNIVKFVSTALVCLCSPIMQHPVYPGLASQAATVCIMLVTGLPDHSPDCKTVQGPITNQLANTFTLVSRASLIAAEVIVLVVTWIATYRRSALREKRQRQTLAHVILFNGEAMLFLNCLQLGFTLASPVGPTRKVLNVSEVTNFSEPITSVLITRFLLDLQRVDQRDVVNLDSNGRLSPHSESEAVVSPHTLRFRGMLESFGSVVVWEGAESTDEDTEYEVTQ
ncbi:hypothetical protein V8D89_015393 [Ganoderma adspersum]